MHLKCKFDNGEFALLAELQPPKGTDISRMVANIHLFRISWTPLWLRICIML
jgi:hypothetical protein